MSQLVDPQISRQFDRLPPHSIEAEQCLLAAMMLDKEIIGQAVSMLERDAFFQTDITPAMFSGFSAQFAPRLKRGYTTTFVTQLRQDGYSVYVWKVEFKDGGDDLLFTLAVKDGKVGGFFLR